MPTWPQYANALLVESANIYQQGIVGGANTAITAKSGDVVLASTDATHTITVTLPPVAQGGPVTVRKMDSNAVAVKVVTSDGSTINGVAGATGVSTTAQFVGWTFVSDGANWWQVGS